jgi:hypothetical protein
VVSLVARHRAARILVRRPRESRCRKSPDSRRDEALETRRANREAVLRQLHAVIAIERAPPSPARRIAPVGVHGSGAVA